MYLHLSQRHLQAAHNPLEQLHVAAPVVLRDVKSELVAAQDRSGDPFLELHEVRLEVSFVLDTTAKAGGKLFVVEVGGETSAQQTHRVSLTLQPLLQPEPETSRAEHKARAAAHRAKPSKKKRPAYA